MDTTAEPFDTSRIMETMSLSDDATTSHSDVLLGQRLSENAVLPTKGTEEAAGYDLYSATDATIKPQSMVKIPTNLAIKLPPGTYCQIWSRSGLLTKYGIETKAGTIDRDYTGDITIVLYSNSTVSYLIKMHDKIAELVVHKIAHPQIKDIPSLPVTLRGKKGFGSTDKDTSKVTDLSCDGLQDGPKLHSVSIPASDMVVTPSSAVTTTPNGNVDDILQAILAEDNIKPYNIWLSHDPYHKCMTVSIPIKGNHPTLGLLVRPTEHNHRVQLYDIEKSTPASKLPRWHSTLKGGIILNLNGKAITSCDDLAQAVQQA
jgi:dUTP pyrophosphatase